MGQMNNLSFILHSPQKVSIESRPSPCIIDAHDVLVKVASTGICGSDLHYYKHGRISIYEVKSPMTLGHESAGIVTEIGPTVTMVQLGDQVAMEPGVPCRYCDYCRSGRYNLCRKMQFAATPPYDGTLCDVYRLPEDFCHKIPASVSLEEGALAEPLSVAVHVTLKQAKVQLGDQVVVFGAGPIGLLRCAVARSYGAEKVIAVDINKSRLDFAKAYAATDVCDAKTLSEGTVEEAAKTLAKQTNLREGVADIIVEASGVESSIRLGIHLAKPDGTFVQAGMGRDDVNFPIGAICGKELDVKGSFRYGPGDYETAIKLITTGRVDVARLITKVVPFGLAEQAFSGAGDPQGIKTIIHGPSFS